ncbi:hypothetical protein HUU61_22175 [Rhodopseudomonas palustris]|nr:hypothetical protein [Rhodopseudomonas palustris]
MSGGVIGRTWKQRRRKPRSHRRVLPDSIVKQPRRIDLAALSAPELCARRCRSEGRGRAAKARMVVVLAMTSDEVSA